jgi:hypothetical protein
MAIEVAEGRRGDIGLDRVQNSLEGDRGLEGTKGFRGGDVDIVQETEGRRENSGPQKDRWP